MFCILECGLLVYKCQGLAGCIFCWLREEHQREQLYDRPDMSSRIEFCIKPKMLYVQCLYFMYFTSHVIGDLSSWLYKFYSFSLHIMCCLLVRVIFNNNTTRKLRELAVRSHFIKCVVVSVVNDQSLFHVVWVFAYSFVTYNL